MHGEIFFSLKYRINAGSEAYYGFISHESRLQKKKDPQVPIFRILRIFFTSCRNGSVPSQLRAKIHSKSAVPIGFLPSILSFLTVSAVNAQTYWTVTSIQYMRPPHTLPLCFLPQKRQSPWNSCIGDKLLQGLCLLNMYHNISLFREIHTGNMNFFAVARQRASRPSIFLAGIQSARKPVSITSTTMWFCNDPASS